MTMADNTEVCSNCGTENPAGQDFCIRCHQPLTASAEEGVRENLDAQDRGGRLGVGEGPGRGVGLDTGVMGGGGMLIPDEPLAPDDPRRHEGLPPRRS
jgi:hypothetical protein